MREFCKFCKVIKVLTKRRYWWLAALAVLGALTLLFVFRKEAMRQAESIGLVEPAVERKQRPQAYSLGVSTVQFDENGAPRYHLRASRMETIKNFRPQDDQQVRDDTSIASYLPSQLASEDISRMEDPAFSVFTESARYLIVADRGYLIQDSEQLEFVGKVLLSRQGQSAAEPTQTLGTTDDAIRPEGMASASTESMSLDIPAKIASSQSAVHVEADRLEFDAQAFKANLETGVLRFYKGVTGTIAPAAAPK